MSLEAALFGIPRLSSLHMARTGISIAFIMASFIRLVFCSTEGERATFDLPGAPSGGKGDRERGIPAGVVSVKPREEPQFAQKLGLVGEDGVDREDGDNVRWVEDLEIARG